MCVLRLCHTHTQAFWLPSQQSESKDLMQKPDSSTYCPASGKKLRLKDCVAVKFTRVREGEGGMYMDPVTLETLTNASKLVVIVPTGVRGGGGGGGGKARAERPGGLQGVTGAITLQRTHGERRAECALRCAWSSCVVLGCVLLTYTVRCSHAHGCHLGCR